MKKTKLLAVILAVLMVFSMIPTAAFANGESTNTQAADAVTKSESELENRIVHLDCGRKYFSVEYIEGVIDTMAKNGFNQLELAFGNGGLRFVLDESGMDIKSGSSTLHNSNDVIDAIKEGNKKFYDDPNGNVLTEKEMKQIIAYAQKNGIEIVPLLNMPGHMDALLSSSLFSQYKLSGSDESLDLNNSYAVDFGKALLKLYVDWFRNNTTTMHFNFGADEYGQGIRNPYIESSVAKVTYNQLINYMNDCATIIEGQGMTARCFNDFVCYNHRTTCNLFKTVEVCYWSNQWNNSEYNTPDVIKNAGYKMINTNQKWYYVPSKSNEYGKSTVLSNLKTYDVSKYQNIKVMGTYNSTSTTYTEIPVGTSNVGAMLAVWCDVPSVDVPLADVQELIVAMADANPQYIFNPTYTQSGVSVSAPGLKGLTVTAKTDAENSAIQAKLSDAEQVAAYDITPETKSGKYTGNGIVKLPIPQGWDTSHIYAVSVDDNKEIRDGKVENNYYVFNVEHFSTYALVLEAQKPDITVTINGTKTVTVDGDVSGEYSNEYVTVTTKVTDKPTPPYYETATLSAGTFYVSGTANDTNPNARLTFEDAGNGQYYIKNQNGTYIYPNASYRYGGVWSYSLGSGKQAVAVRTNSDGSVTISKDYSYYNWSSTTAYLTIDGSSFASGKTTASIYLYNAGKQTKITFKGVKETPKATAIEIGGVTYLVTVVPQEIGNAAPLYVDFWVTNHRIYPTGLDVTTTSSNTKKQARTYYKFSAGEFYNYGEDGRALADVIPATGNYESKTGTEAVYWKTRYLPQQYRQTEAGWTNKSGDGTDTVTGEKGGKDIERIRYYNDEWQYKTANGEWTTFTTSENEAGNQIVAYYLLKTKVTDEVTTYITDWPDKQTDSFYGVALDYCVKYESSGTRTPSSFGSGSNVNTQWFNCDGSNTGDAWKNGYTLSQSNAEALSNGDWSGNGKNEWYRVINNIRGVETAQYEIYMITVTPSTAFSSTVGQTCPSSITYPESGEKAIWAEDTDTVTTSGLTAHAEIKYGGTPEVNRVVIQQCTGMLLTYYVRAKATPDALRVHYIDQTADGKEFYGYHISVSQGILFPELKNQFENGTLKNYNVTNSEGKVETVQSDLSQMPKIDAQYRYSKYTCVNVERSEDGKDFYLYYTFDNNVTFVVDFGLPLIVTPEKVNGSLKGKANQVEIVKKNVNYGTVEVDANEPNFTYTLNKTIDGYETINATYVGTNLTTDKESKVTYNVNIIPATTVYYEDSFASFTDKDGNTQTGFKAATDNDEIGTWYIDGTKATADQALSALGSKDIYGYDAAYDNSQKFSLGSAKKVTVNQGTNATAPAAQFTFTGTGFDIVSVTNSKSGAIYAYIYSGTDTSGSPVKSYVVNDYYGYRYDKETKTWAVDPDASDTLYQIPVMKVTDLAYGQYTVIVKVGYSAYQDVANAGQYSFWMDAIRVYDPMGKDKDTYTKDDEGYPQYIKLRDQLASSAATATGNVVFIDGAESAGIADYANYGPNNEVYLANGQAISFTLTGDVSKIASVQLGAKAPNGAATLNVNDTVVKELNTATEMYYDVTAQAVNTGAARQITITNKGKGILSLTNLKVTYTEKGSVSMGVLTDTQQTDAVMAVRALFAPVVKTFDPERFEASWNRNSVRAGQRATLTVKTSTEVEAITVNGETISGYRTRTERTGWGWNAKRVTYREFTYTVTASATADYTVAALNAEGTASAPITATLTVTQSSGNRQWWNIFSWF